MSKTTHFKLSTPNIRDLMHVIILKVLNFIRALTPTAQFEQVFTYSADNEPLFL